MRCSKTRPRSKSSMWCDLSSDSPLERRPRCSGESVGAPFLARHAEFQSIYSLLLHIFHRFTRCSLALTPIFTRCALDFLRVPSFSSYFHSILGSFIASRRLRAQIPRRRPLALPLEALQGQVDASKHGISNRNGSNMAREWLEST